VGVANISALCRLKIRLSIKASVTDKGEGKTRATHDKSVIFTDHPLILNMGNTPSFFKPQLPFAIQVHVSSAFTTSPSTDFCEKRQSKDLCVIST